MPGLIGTARYRTVFDELKNPEVLLMFSVDSLIDYFRAETAKTRSGSPRRSKAGCETTIWFASLGLVLVGGLFATKVVSATIPERPTAVGGPTAPGIALLRDTLTKPDKTAVSHRGT